MLGKRVAETSTVTNPSEVLLTVTESTMILPLVAAALASVLNTAPAVVEYVPVIVVEKANESVALNMETPTTSPLELRTSARSALRVSVKDCTSPIDSAVIPNCRPEVPIVVAAILP